MASRPQGVQGKTLIGTGAVDTILKAARGNLYSFNISWTGGNAGDVVHIHDSATADPTATKIFSFRVHATTGAFAAVLPAVGKEALNGLWLNLQTTGTYHVDVGFD